MMWFMFWWIGNLLGIVFLIIAILYAVRAYKGERFAIPIVYDIMRKFYKEVPEGVAPAVKAPKV